MSVTSRLLAVEVVEGKKLVLLLPAALDCTLGWSFGIRKHLHELMLDSLDLVVPLLAPFNNNNEGFTTEMPFRNLKIWRLRSKHKAHVK